MSVFLLKIVDKLARLALLSGLNYYELVVSAVAMLSIVNWLYIDLKGSSLLIKVTVIRFRRARACYWLTISVRCVSRTSYILCIYRSQWKFVIRLVTIVDRYLAFVLLDKRNPIAVSDFVVMLLILVLIKACIDALQLLRPVVMQWQCFWAPFSYGNNIGAVYCSHSFLGRWFGLVHDLDSKLCLVVCNSFERWWASWPVEFWHLYHNFDIVQTFEAIVLCFYNNRICISINVGKGNYSIIILTN